MIKMKITFGLVVKYLSFCSKMHRGRDETAFNEGRPTADMKAKCRHEGIFITFSFFHEGIFITFLLFCLHR